MKLSEFIISALGLSLYLSSPASAQLYNYSYNDTGGKLVTAKPDTAFLNPSGVITLNLISGLDRKERVTVTRDSDKTSMFEGTTSLVTVADRITSIDGAEYYGKSLVLPTLGEGAFTLKSDTLDNKGNLVSSSTYPFSIDITAPSIPDPIVWIRAGFMNGSIDVFGNTTATQALSVSRLSDAGSGLSKAEWFAIDDAGTRRAVPTDLNPLTGEALAPAAIAAGVVVAPKDQSYYTVGFRIYDKAGNYRDVTHRSAIDRTVPAFMQYQVQNAATGVWQDYVPGMTIYANPLQFRFKMRKQDAADFNGTDFGWYGQGKSSDADFAYINATLSYPETYNYYEIFTKAGLRHHLSFNTLRFTLGPGVSEAPRYVKGIFHLKNANTWSDGDTVRMTSPDCVDSGVVTTEVRSYTQLVNIDNVGSCTIAPNQTSCTLTTNFCKLTDRGYDPRQIIITGTDAYAGLGGRGSYLYSYWDYNPPVINSVTVKPEEKQIVMRVTDADTVNDWRSYMWVTNSFALTLTDGSGKALVLSPASVNSLNFQLKEVVFSYGSLSSGQYTASASATDTYGNQATTKLPGTIKHDVAPPIVSVMFKGQPADGQLVRGLENLEIHLTDDMTQPSIISVSLEGGPTSDKVKVGWYNKGNNISGLQYPRIFPSTDDDDSYTLTVVASDEAGNVTTKASRFRYVPDNLIEFNNIKTLAVNTSLKATDNTPLAFLQTNSIRKKNGELVTGPQTGTLSVRKDAAFGITLNGITVVAGETKDITINFGSGDGILIPVFPAEKGKRGISDFILELPQID